MAIRNWTKLNKIFTTEEDPHFQKYKASQLISKLDLTLTQHGQESAQEIEVVKALRPLFGYYQLLGILPISINKGNTSIWIKKIWWKNPLWFLTIISLTIQATMVIRSGVKVIQTMSTNSLSEEVEAGQSLIYFSHSFLMTIIMLYRLHLLPAFIDACKNVEKLCKKYEPKKDNLVTHCWTLFGYFATSQLFGNALYYYAEVKRSNATSASQFSDVFELDGEQSSEAGFAYMIFELYCDCVWTFGDVLIALMSLILMRFFGRLNKGIYDSKGQTVQEVEELRKDHRAIKDLVEQCNLVFSPIILVNFLGNIAYLLARLYIGIFGDLKNSVLIIRIETIYAFVYQVLKIMVPTWLAALLNEKAFEALDKVHDWPSLIQLPDTRTRMMVINRFVSQLINDPVGLSGCGYFTITKSFLVTLISGILTYEVIILQFQQAGL